MKRFAFSAVLLAIISSANAGFDSGNDLYKYCTDSKGSTPSDGFRKGMCFGLISGYFENLHMAYQCKLESPEITRQQVVDIVVNELRDNPAKRHLPANIIATAVLIRVFDCESWVGNGPPKNGPKNSN
jgi:Rap1a immunity proteins